jgi:hypothetical protein
MSHVYSFFLTSLIIWLTPRIYRDASWSSFLGIGFSLAQVGYIVPNSHGCVKSNQAIESQPFRCFLKVGDYISNVG